MQYSHIFITVLVTLSTLLSAQPNSFTVMGPGGGGALFAPSISPYDSDEVYIVCDMAGVYHSEDAGAAWDMFHYDDLTSTQRAQMQFTSDPNVLYTVRSRVGSLYRRYPVKSTDGGTTWTALTDPDESLFWYIFADPNHTERVIIGTYDGVWLSTNGGDDWTEIYHDNQEELYTAGAFWDGNNIFVATSRGLHISTNGGNSFSLDNTAGLPASTGFFDFCGAKEGNTIHLYATLLHEDFLYPEAEIYHADPAAVEGLFRLNWNSGNWTAMNNINNEARPYLVDMPIDDLSTIYTVGLRADDLPNVYKSTNGGNSWANTFLTENNENITTGYAGYFGDFSWWWAGSAVAMDVSDSDPNAVLVTDFGFSHYTQDGGQNWRQNYVTPATQNEAGSPTPEGEYYQSSGLDLTTCYNIFWLDENELFVMYTDVGLQYTQDGGETWTYSRGDSEESNWYQLAAGNGANNIIYAAVSELNDLYLAYRISDDEIDNAGGKVLRTYDVGQNWEVAHDFGHPVSWVEVHPTQPSTIYASVCHTTEGGIYRSTDGGDTWTHLPDPPRTEGRPHNIRFLSNGDIVVSFSARDATGNEDYTASAGVFLSIDGGMTWQDRTHPEMQYYTQDVIIDPQNDNIWYATVFDHYDDNGVVQNGGLYRTQNQGQVWQKIHTYGETHSAAVHPENSNIVYLARESGGLYYTENALANDPTFTKVESFPYLRPKRIHFNPFDVNEVWITTMGGAVWKGSTAPDATQNNITNTLKINVLQNPFQEKTALQIDVEKSGTAILSLYNAEGQLLRQTQHFLPQGAQQIELMKADFGQSGIYYYSLKIGDKVGRGQLILIH